MLKPVRVSLVALALAGATPALAQPHEHHHAPAAHEAAPAPAESDGRIAVKFPAMLKEHTLASMRDHLRTLSEIQGHLAGREFDRAARIAEERLGMSSLPLHGAHEVAKYMPEGMQDAGTAMHRSASRFAVAMQKAAIDQDVGRALAALNEVTRACVACHAAYRLE